MAKETGKRWQDLPYKERMDIWEKPVSDKMEEYAVELERYKDTENYRNYQKYLKHFYQAQQKSESAELLNSETASISRHSEQPPTLPGAEGLQVANQDRTPDSPSFSRLSSNIRTQNLQPTMVEVEGPLNNLDILHALPPEDLTLSAVEAFLRGTGSLLYLWNHDDAANLTKSIYSLKSNTPQLDAIEVFAMSAVGNYCDAEPNKGSTQEESLDTFIGLLSTYSEICDLRLMRLHACLGICRFTNDVEHARESICKPSIVAENGHCRLTIRSIRTQYRKADIDLSNFCVWKVRERCAPLVECFQKYYLPRKVCRNQELQRIRFCYLFPSSWFSYNTGLESRIIEEDLIVRQNYYFASSYFGVRWSLHLHPVVLRSFPTGYCCPANRSSWTSPSAWSVGCIYSAWSERCFSTKGGAGSPPIGVAQSVA